MDPGDLHLHEYQRALAIVDKYEQNSDRLILFRSLFLLVAVMFLTIYLGNYEEVRLIREQVVLDTEEARSTVFGYITAHQRIDNLVSVPDEKAEALITLIPRLASFLGEELTLENQSQRPVAEILERASTKPEGIRIENPYLPRLVIPVSYTSLSVGASWLILASFFYFSFRRIRLGRFMRYAYFHLDKFDKQVDNSGKASLPARPQLVGRGLAAAFGAEARLSWEQIRGSILSANWLDGMRQLFRSAFVANGRSPFRFLNWIVTLYLFAHLVGVTSQIVLSEHGISRTWYSYTAFLLLLIVIPGAILMWLNRYFLSQQSAEDESFLLRAEEW